MGFFKIIYFIFFFLILMAETCLSQSSLYLVDTLTGTPDNKLLKAIGIGDMNGDGYADFVVCYQKYIDLYFGNPQFNLKPVHRFYLPKSSNYFQGSAYAIGDVNGDGYADLMIINGDTSYNPIYPYCEIIIGGEELDTIPKFIYYPPYYWEMGITDGIYPLGDLNGAGYNDFAISMGNWGDEIGRVYIFKGGKTLIDTPWVVMEGPGPDNGFGATVTGIGDFNNDGYNDFLISAPLGDSGKVYIYLGNKDSISAIPYKIFGPKTFYYLHDVKFAGNLDGNGKKDFIISADQKAFIYHGNSDPIIYDDPLIFGKYGYATIGTGGDINNDGYDDFLIGNAGYRNSDSLVVGIALGFWGGKSIDISNPAFQMEGDQQYFYFSQRMDIPGDINGDGYADVFIMQPLYPDMNNPGGKLFIYSYKKITGIKGNGNASSPSKFELNQNYPNPFNPSTVISWQLAVAVKSL